MQVFVCVTAIVIASISSLPIWASSVAHELSDHESHPQRQSHQIIKQVIRDSATTFSFSGLSTSPSTNSQQFWYEAIPHNGENSYMNPFYKPNYKVFRNVVVDFGADNTGRRDSSTAIQNAITAGASNGPARNANKMGASGQPAVVYIPGGTYLLKSSLQLYLGTVIMGDPLNLPVLKAGSGFSEQFIVRAKDPSFGGTNNFFVGIKNIVIDSTDVDPGQELTLLDWTVSQATQLTNVIFSMPISSSTTSIDSTMHVGLSTFSDSNSNLILNDLQFHGGQVGLNLGAQQWVFKNITFSGTTIGVVAGGFDIVFVGCHWEHGRIGINARPTKGSLTVIDSSSVDLDSLIESYNSFTAENSIILENIRSDGTTVALDGEEVLIGDLDGTWVHGNLYHHAVHGTGNHVKGEKVITKRSPSLLVDGNQYNYFIMRPPIYEKYSVDDIVNVKLVPQFPVYGDGETDDTVNINAILSTYAGSKVIYFPAGTYIVTGTVFVPPESRIFGDAFASAISAQGSNFKNEYTPTTMVRIGLPGDVGVAQFNDMLFTVSDVLEGCKLLEINIAGNKPGDVGLWNSHFRIGGTKDTKVETNCTGSPSQCKAAWGLIHLTPTSSAYIENLWGWTADHDLDGNNKQTISTARGMLIEATKGTWLIGTGLEHHTLYQYNFNGASNVFTALQQSETPYWQGEGSPDLAPAPWSSSLIASDPDFSNCHPNDSKCRMAWFELIKNSSNLFLYGGGIWVFFNDNGNCHGGWCQANAIRVENSNDVYFYGTNTRSITNIVLEGSRVAVTADEHVGGWGGVVAGMLV